MTHGPQWADHQVDGMLVREARDTRVPQRGHVVMVHGAQQGWWVFERWIPPFTHSGWTCLALSLPNHTGSRVLPEQEFLSLTVMDYVHDVLRVVDRLAPRAALLGHSMGGLLTQLVAERTAPEALVLVSSVGPGQLGAMRTTSFPPDEPVVFGRDLIRERWFHRISETAMDAVMTRVCPEPPSVVNAYSDGSVHVDTRAVRCPVLVVGPQVDRTPVHDARRIAELYGVRPLLVPEVGHSMMLEDEGVHVASAITQWLDANAVGRGREAH
ncbi:alpha/beta fold hydrolase [Streptomyces anandii]|uniref:Alpha/beta fold hydrolase n=1 Tax=Streptomyces anandii TaxID=285454 RepID=A0ABW6H953_9ACTN